MLLVILLAATIGMFVFYFYHNFTYWERRRIPSYPSPSLITGHANAKIVYQLEKIYKYFKNKGYKHGGFYIFQQHIYMPTDPYLLKHIMAKNHDHFTEKGLYTNEKDQPISLNLFTSGGDRWKTLRAMMKPTFSFSKLRNLYPLILDCSKPLVRCIEEHTKSKKMIDIKDLFSKYTTDVIGSCAFGIDCNSFKDSQSEFLQRGIQLFAPTFSRVFKEILAISFPKICHFFGLILIERSVEAFYTNITLNTIKFREEKKITRNDYLQLLLTLRENEDPDKRVNMQDIITQSFVFYAAGSDASSVLMAFTFLELARNPEIQDKLREEITQVLGRHKNEITYDAINEMKYLSQVMDESLRMYPPVFFLPRGCSKEYTIPGTDSVLEKDTLVFIPLHAIHHDEDYYPEPERFDPERFSDENRASRLPYTFLPFGEGPRNCIGLRFGYLQAKIGLVTLLHRFKFAVHSNTEYPIKIKRGFGPLQPESNIMLTSIPV